MALPQSRSGFTLIELLTVIAIIAILMALLFPTFRTTNIITKKASARHDLSELTTAVKSFYGDYGLYPVDSAASVSGNPRDAEYGDMDGGGTRPISDVVNVLRADPSNDPLSTGATPLSINTRKTIYLEVPFVKDSSNPKSYLGDGTETNSNLAHRAPGNWYDPWGYTYIVVIDTNYDGYTDANTLGNYTDLKYLTINGHPSVQTGCIGASFGADHICGIAAAPNVYAGSDDVLSWQ